MTGKRRPLPLPMGCTNSNGCLQGTPATFQRMVDKLLDGLGEISSAYIDDVIIFSRSWPDHLVHLDTVFQRIQQAGLTGKCQFAMQECVYLGHSVGCVKVRPEEMKVKSIREFPVPTTKTQIWSFLGLTGYYRKSLYPSTHP